MSVEPGAGTDDDADDDDDIGRATATTGVDMTLNQWSDTILIAELADEPAFSDDLETLSRQLGADDNDDSVPHIILDMSQVTFLHSSNLTQLLRIRKKSQLGKRHLRVCAVSDKVWSVFLVTGLDKIFDFTDDVSTSIASLQIESA